MRRRMRSVMSGAVVDRCCVRKRRIVTVCYGNKKKMSNICLLTDGVFSVIQICTARVRNELEVMAEGMVHVCGLMSVEWFNACRRIN